MKLQRVQFTTGNHGWSYFFDPTREILMGICRHTEQAFARPCAEEDLKPHEVVGEVEVPAAVVYAAQSFIERQDNLRVGLVPLIAA
ncbi:MAG: hypothetical protein WAV15_02765 [Minisyncoccia bacterium]